MSNLRIALVQERPGQAYYSGSTITGNVLLDLAEPRNYKYVSIQFVGRSYVHWEERRSESSGNQQRHVTYRYTSEHQCADQVLMLWTCQQSPDGKLGAAEYSWPFSFAIPPRAPSSFEGTVGNIRYSLEARIGTGVFKFDHTVQVNVPVQQLVRISDPRLLLPEQIEAEKTLCCLCCASGPITLNASVPKTGFCIGESFSLHASLENGSSRRVTLSASIHQRVIYMARGHQRTSSKTLVDYASDPIEPRATREWDPTIEIPLAEIVHEGSCENIHIQYSLVVAAKIPNAIDLSRAIPLQLGNCTVQPQNVPPGPPAQGALHLPPGGAAAYPPPNPPSHLGSGYQPQPTSAPYPPQPPAGTNPPAAGWSAPPSAPYPESGSVPQTLDKLDSPDPPNDSETARLL